MKPLSASGAERVVKCPGSAHLPQIASTGEWAERGTTIHEFCRRIVKGLDGREEMIKKAPKKDRELLEIINSRDTIIEYGECIMCEPAFIIDVRTGDVRFLGENIYRNYGDRSPYEVGVSLDVVWKSVGGELCIDDWKTGMAVALPEDNYQIKLQAYAVMKHFGLDEINAGVTYIDSAGDFNRVAQTLTALDVDFTLEEVKTAIDVALSASADQLHEGSWCKYCPAANSCPAKINFAFALIGKLTEIGTVSTMSPVEAGQAWELAKRAEKLAEDIIEKLKAIDDIQLPNGKAVRPILATTKAFDQSKARGLILQLGGTTEDLDSLYSKNTHEKYMAVKK